MLALASISLASREAIVRVAVARYRPNAKSCWLSLFNSFSPPLPPWEEVSLFLILTTAQPLHRTSQLPVCTSTPQPSNYSKLPADDLEILLSAPPKSHVQNNVQYIGIVYRALGQLATPNSQPHILTLSLLALALGSSPWKITCCVLEYSCKLSGLPICVVAAWKMPTLISQMLPSPWSLQWS